MATLFSSLKSGQNPTMLYTVTYSQTARDASSVTYSVKVSAILANPSTGYFNALVYPKIKIGGTTVSFDDLGKFPKGTTTAKTSTKTVKVTGINAGTSSLSYTFSATTQLGGTSSSSTGYVSGKAGTIPVSIYATTPSMSGSLTIKDGSKTLSSYFRENIGSSNLTMSWSKASNANGTLKYQLRRSINGGDYTDVTTTTSLSATNAPGAVNTVRYAVRAMNTVGSTTLYSSWIYSNTLTKNSFSTNPTVTSSASVSYGTKSFTFTVGAAKDRLGSAMTYTIAGISPTAISGTTTIGTGSRTINTNNGATGTYMTLAQLKTAALNGATASNTSTYKGTLKFKITAKNEYGSTKTVDLSVPIDLGKDAPISNAVPALSIADASYYTVGSTKYILPAYKSVTLSIANGVQDALGRYCSYDILMTDTSSSTTTTIKNTGVKAVTAAFTATVSGSEAGMGSAKKNVKFQIRAKTANGVTKNGTATSAVDLHYYSKPTITASNIVRENNKASFKITVKQNTSLSVTNVHTLPANYTQSGLTGTTTQTYTLTRTGLTESLSEKVIVKVQDAAGNALKSDGSLISSVQVSIPSFQPMLSIRKKGVGVNCVNAGSEGAMLKVNGQTVLTHDLHFTGSATHIRRGDLTGSNNFCSGKLYNDSPCLSLYATSYSDTSIAGDFRLRAGANEKVLIGKANGTLSWAGNNVITSAGGIFTGSVTTGAKQLDSRLTTGNQQIYNVSSDGTKMYFGNPATSVQVEGSALTLSGATTCNSAIKATSFQCASNGLLNAQSGYVVVRASDSSIVYLQGGEVRATEPANTGTYVNFRAHQIRSGNVLLNGYNSIINDSHSLWLEGTNEGYTSKSAHIQLSADSTSAYVKSSTIYDRTYSGSANVHVTSNGVIGRSTSARRYKLDIADMKEGQPEKILNLVPKTWFDKTSTEQYADYLTRTASGDEYDINLEDIPFLDRQNGLIAEEVEEVGLGEFVNYGLPDENGIREVQGLQYDRLWILLIPLVREQREKIAALEDRVQELEQTQTRIGA